MCPRCEGCGQIADTADGEPWSAWESLSPGADMSIRLGLVRPLTCPDCEGRGSPAPTTADDAAQIERAVAHISDMLNASYAPGTDAEAVLWRRVTKVCEEAGEVQNALRGLVAENPRKGRTHSVDDVVKELLDCAGAALGAAYHLRRQAVLPALREIVVNAETRLVEATQDVADVRP